MKTLTQKSVYGLFWEPRVGKTKTVIDAACVMRDAGMIDTVVIVCPAQVKDDVWVDRKLGEVAKHCWLDYTLINYNARTAESIGCIQEKSDLVFVCASMEFLRRENAHQEQPNVEALRIALKGKRYWLVVDEASAIASIKALQTKAVLRLRFGATRFTELDGTPGGDTPLDIFAKAYALDPTILGYRSEYEFKRAHCTIEKVKKKGQKRPFEQIVEFKDLEVISTKMKPHCEYIKRCDVFDMPAVVPGVMSIALTPATWKLYRQMRDELVAELDTGIVTVNNSAVKFTRLAQLCAGFIGGVQPATALDFGMTYDAVEGILFGDTEEVSRESCDATMKWLESRFAEELNFKCIIWCRWTREIDRLVAALGTTRAFYTNIMRHDGVRKDANVLHREGGHDGPITCVAHPAAAQYGLDFSRADTELWLSCGYSLVQRTQAGARFQADDGITRQSLDVIVTGPDGQRTISHDVAQALRDKEVVATRTTAEWRKILMEE